jgi:hypothetical protein
VRISRYPTIRWPEILPEASNPVNKKVQARQVIYEMRHPNYATRDLEGFTLNRVKYVLNGTALNNNFFEKSLIWEKRFQFTPVHK